MTSSPSSSVLLTYSSDVQINGGGLRERSGLQRLRPKDAFLFDAGWYRQLAVEDLSASALGEAGLPDRYDAVMMSGNVPAFLTPESLQRAFLAAADALTPGGTLVSGTTTAASGGPHQQDTLAASAGLALTGRFADWHCAPHTVHSEWTVSVFSKPGARVNPGPDGIFVLK